MKKIFTILFLFIGFASYSQAYLEVDNKLVDIKEVSGKYIQVTVFVAKGSAVQVIINDEQQLPYKLKDKEGNTLKIRVSTFLELFENDWEITMISYDNSYRIILRKKDII